MILLSDLILYFFGRKRYLHLASFKRGLAQIAGIQVNLFLAHKSCEDCLVIYNQDFYQSAQLGVIEGRGLNHEEGK